MLRILYMTLVGLVIGLAVVSASSADSTPIGPLPAHPTSTISTHRGLLVSVALPRQAASTGLVWRLARPFDSRVLRQVSEADVGRSVVIVFRVVGEGRTAVVFALTRGDASPKAVRAVASAVRVG